MKAFFRYIATIVLVAFVAGCANTDVKPGEIICPILGATAGAGLAAGAFDSDDEAAGLAVGAILGAAAGYALCKDRQPEPVAQPAPRPAPKPKPKPAPPKDTDGDGVIDPNDKCPGTPRGVKVNSDGCPEVGEKLITLEGVNFDTNKATIKAESESILMNAVKVMNENSSVHVRVEGHTDSRGSASYNQGLSERRAQAVVDWMASHGVDANRMSPIGYGESSPVAPNDSDENMYKNRRVDFVVTSN